LINEISTRPSPARLVRCVERHQAARLTSRPSPRSSSAPFVFRERRAERPRSSAPAQQLERALHLPEPAQRVWIRLP
jgi:hypothetical protein